MAKTKLHTSGVITPGSLNLAVNPLVHREGDMIRCLNVENDLFGAKKKRPGYTTYLGTMPNGSAVQDLGHWTNNTGTQMWNYALAGGNLYYSTQGTGAWTICGNGTLSSAGTLTSAVLEDTLLVGDGVSATRHTTNGTSFTNTTNAPIAVSMEEYHQRIFAAGTAETLFWSVTGTPTDWTSADSSSINIPGAGKLTKIFKSDDRLMTMKNSGAMHRYDEYNLFDLSTNKGVASSRSLGTTEQLRFGLNRSGIFSYSASEAVLLSSALEKQIYNDVGKGIVGTSFDNSEGVFNEQNYEYFLSVGTVTDDLTDEEIGNAILVYDYQTNEWWNNQFNDRPRAWLSYVDASGDSQLVFAAGNQCYTYGKTNLNDNGVAIPVVMEGIIHMQTLLDKKWHWLRMLFNPGCEASIQVAISDTFTKAKKDWISLGQALDGVVEYRFPERTRGKMLFWKISESAQASRLHFYGMEYSAEVILR